MDRPIDCVALELLDLEFSREFHQIRVEQINAEANRTRKVTVPSTSAPSIG
jgi:hypothetical protein